MQEPPIAKVEGKAAPEELAHVFVWEKLPLFAPAIPMLLMTNGAVPVLDRVTAVAACTVDSICALPSATLPVDRDATGAVPVPVSGTVTLGLEAPNEIVSILFTGPAAVGLKVVLNVQLAPGFNVFSLQPPPAANGVEAETLRIVMAAAPVFVRVTVWEGLFVPTN